MIALIVLRYTFALVAFQAHIVKDAEGDSSPVSSTEKTGHRNYTERQKLKQTIYWYLKM